MGDQENITKDLNCIRFDGTAFTVDSSAPVSLSFSSLIQVRLPPNTSDDVDEDPTGNKALWDRGLLNGASQKVKLFLVLRSTVRFPFRSVPSDLNFYLIYILKYNPL